MTRDDLLDEANAKLLNMNVLYKEDWDLPMDLFILRNFNVCNDPSTKGNNLQNKIMLDHSDIITRASDKKDQGDYKILGISGYDKFGEVKTSYSNKKDKCGIKNIRLYQNIDIYIIGIVDCADDFKSHFYCIKPQNIVDNFKLTAMHGTKSANKDNTKIAYATTFDVEKGMKKLSKINLLDGDTYEDLSNFILGIKYNNNLYQSGLLKTTKDFQPK